MEHQTRADDVPLINYDDEDPTSDLIASPPLAPLFLSLKKSSSPLSHLSSPIAPSPLASPLSPLKPFPTDISENICIKTVTRRLNFQLTHHNMFTPISSANTAHIPSDNVIGDYIRIPSLPTVSGRHTELNYITPSTMFALLAGDYKEQVFRYTIIDCRYSYEYDGGHIRGAVNVPNKAALHQHMQGDFNLQNQDVALPSNHIIIFHCEFSSERGPRMCRYLREVDRATHADSYPSLSYPEIYILHGGYKDFYSMCPDLCEPRAYVPMLHEDHRSQLKQNRFRSNKEKIGSWKFSYIQQLHRMCDLHC